MHPKDNVAIISGAGRGIGQATAVKFAAEGARVVVRDIDDPCVRTAVELIGAAGGQSIRFVVDVMCARNSGCIVNASSIVGIDGNFGQTNCAATKFGVTRMVRTWASDQGRKAIRANEGTAATSVAPGPAAMRHGAPSAIGPT